MFIDYYNILEVDENATQDEIKAAFRRQAIRWHPDRNAGKDTTIQMQQINEAYLILKDPEARQKYNLEYQLFKNYRKEKANAGSSAKKEYQADPSFTSNANADTGTEEFNDYTFSDDTLRNWMDNARKQSVDLARQTIKELKEMVAIGVKEGVKATGRALMGQIILSFVILLIMGLSKACNN
jgi:curved DNA-binding protein CbpA